MMTICILCTHIIPHTQYPHMYTTSHVQYSPVLPTTHATTHHPTPPPTHHEDQARIPSQFHPNAQSLALLHRQATLPRQACYVVLDEVQLNQLHDLMCIGFHLVNMYIRGEAHASTEIHCFPYSELWCVGVCLFYIAVGGWGGWGGVLECGYMGGSACICRFVYMQGCVHAGLCTCRVVYNTTHDMLVLV